MLIKKIVLKVVTKITNLITKVILTDTHNGLKVYRLSAIKKLDIRLDGSAFETDLIFQVGKKGIKYKESVEDAIRSIPVKENDIILITGSLYLAGEVLNLN